MKLHQGEVKNGKTITYLLSSDRVPGSELRVLHTFMAHDACTLFPFYIGGNYDSEILSNIPQVYSLEMVTQGLGKGLT